MSRFVESGIDLSVVISTYNRAASLRRTLGSLINQIAPGVAFEIVVVDDGSSDETVPVVKELSVSGRPEVRLIELGHVGAPAARNAGIEDARGDLVLLLDDDMECPQGLLLSHCQLHAMFPGESTAIVGLPSLHPEESLRDAVFGWRWAPEDPAVIDGRWTDFFSGQVSLPRDVVLSVGAFDRGLDYLYDLELGHRLENAGVRIIIARHLISRHLCPILDFEDVLARARSEGRSLAAWCSKSPKIFDEIQEMGKTAADFGFPIRSGGVWQVFKDRLDRYLVTDKSVWLFQSLLSMTRRVFPPVAVRIARRLYRHELRAGFDEDLAAQSAASDTE